jgi:hypothetical protein
MKSKIVFNRLEIEISTLSGIEYYPYSDLIWVQYDKPYCIFYCKRGKKRKKYLVLTSLKKISGKFPAVFFKCNQSTIVNIRHLQRYDIIKCALVMDDDTSFALPHYKKPVFIAYKSFVEQIPIYCADCKLYTAQKGKRLDTACNVFE